jgi:hypothetical protein
MLKFYLSDILSQLCLIHIDTDLRYQILSAMTSPVMSLKMKSWKIITGTTLTSTSVLTEKEILDF